jgi:hypothetical protein
MAPLLERDDFQSIHHETTVVDEQVTTKFKNKHQRGNVKADFCMTIIYHYDKGEQDGDDNMSEDENSDLVASN